MKLFYKFLPLLLTISFYSMSNAQISEIRISDRVEIVLEDGNRIIGQVEDIASNKLILLSESLGEIEINRNEITEVKILTRGARRSDPISIPTDFHNSTHYFANPSAYGLKKGQKYYENIGVFFNTFSFGITDNISFSIGGEIASLLFASEFPIVYMSTKISAPFGEDKGAVGLNAVFFSAPTDDFEGFGVLQGNVTIGSRNSNGTVGIGFGFSTDGGFADEVIPAQLSLMHRISKKISFVTDNFFVFYDDFDDLTGVLSAGVRIHFKRNGAVFNAALWRATEGMGDVFALPFVSATIPLGDR